jgi:hypothetical protein
VQSEQATIAIRDSKSKDGRCLILTVQAWRQLLNPFHPAYASRVCNTWMALAS